MESKSPRRSLLVVSLTVALAGAFVGSACNKPKPAAEKPGPAPSATGSSAPVVAAKGRDVCEHAADPCACAADEGAKLLAASFPERALQVVSHAPTSCVAPALLGARAEALAAVERGAEANALATSVLSTDPQNRWARRALAIAAIQKSDWTVATAALSKLASEDVKDADSLYYLAVIQRKGDHYNGAREGFLHVLRINPQFVSARFNLVTLTASAGAAQEAEHHYQELLQIAPVGDPRLIAARTALHADSANAPSELPVLHQTSAPNASANAASAPAVLPPR